MNFTLPIIVSLSFCDPCRTTIQLAYEIKPLEVIMELFHSPLYPHDVSTPTAAYQEVWELSSKNYPESYHLFLPPLPLL